VPAWKETEYPQIVAEAKIVGATIYFVDEASVRSDYHADSARTASLGGGLHPG